MCIRACAMMGPRNPSISRFLTTRLCARVQRHADPRLFGGRRQIRPLVYACMNTSTYMHSTSGEYTRLSRDRAAHRELTQLLSREIVAWHTVKTNTARNEHACKTRGSRYVSVHDLTCRSSLSNNCIRDRSCPWSSICDGSL